VPRLVASLDRWIDVSELALAAAPLPLFFFAFFLSFFPLFISSK
jgi:hypothetical protein